MDQIAPGSPCASQNAYVTAVFTFVSASSRTQMVERLSHPSNRYANMRASKGNPLGIPIFTRQICGLLVEKGVFIPIYYRIVVFPKKKRLRLLLVCKGYTPRFQDGDLFLYGSERLILAPPSAPLSKQRGRWFPNGLSCMQPKSELHAYQ